jgi:DNA-binding response OmpR family regulator
MSDNRILMIDDEPGILALLTKVARRCGYDVQSTCDAEIFHQFCRDWNPTHIVLDLQMPGTDGIELLRALAHQRCTAQIIVMSGFDARVLNAARRLGAERGLTMGGALSKPARLADLEALFNALKTP